MKIIAALFVLLITRAASAALFEGDKACETRTREGGGLLSRDLPRSTTNCQWRVVRR